MSNQAPSTSGLSAIERSNLPRGAIGMSGQLVGRNVRLPSIKGPRDLTLGTSLKRTFAPNIPVRREKKSIENSSDKSSQSTKESSSNSRGGRSRGRGKKTFVQTPGAVFGEGVTGHIKSSASRYSDYTPNVTGVNIPKPVFKSDVVIKKEKVEDEAQLYDNFIDDGDDGSISDEDKDMLPVAVPLKNSYHQSKVDIKDSKHDLKPNIPKIKQEILSPITKAEVLELEKFERLALHSDFIEKDDLFLMEFPNYFLSEFGGSSSKSNANGESNIPTCSPESQWSSINDGYIGKLQFLQNGKSRLVIGPYKFEVFSKRPSPFLQELISVHTCDNVSEMTVIGHVKHEVRFLPNVLDLLEDSGEKVIQ